MASCRQCGKELPKAFLTDICTNCSKANLRKTLNADPELKKAYKEAVKEASKPENIKKMAEDTVRFMQTIQVLQKGETE